MRYTLFLSILALLLVFPQVISAQDDPDEISWDGPGFDLENLDGDEMSEDEVFADGTLFLVDFWASWCRPCSMYLPHLELMADEYGDRGFRVVLFCVDEAGSISTARAHLLMENYPFTILFDPEADIQDELGVRRIPTTVIFDASGEELWRHVGYEHGNEEDIREQIEELLPPLDSVDEEANEEEAEEIAEDEAEEG